MSAPELIGRRRELAELEAALEAARQKQGRVVLLAGDVGVGKTRLADDALARADFRVLRGRAREGATPPYGPIVSSLRDWARESPSAVRECGPLASHLALLLPELGPAPLEADHELLVVAILDAIVSAAGGRGTVLCLDDVQWADNATLELLPRLADRIVAEPLCVVAAYRSDELGRDHPIRRLRDDLRRARRFHEIRLKPLSRDESGTLLEHALGSAASPELVDLVHDRTQGIPLYIEELAAALGASGQLQSNDHGVGLVPGETIPLPESVRDAVLLRLDVLSEPARTQLDIASVVGTEFALELVTKLAGEEASFQELVERNLVREVGAGFGAFRNALIREAIRSEITWSRRRSLHRRIAAYMERASAPPEQVAPHWLGANENAPARKALLEIAERSCRLHAYRDAASAMQRALDIWPDGEEEEQRVQALQRLAHCAQVNGQLSDAVRALREVVASDSIDPNHGRRAEVLRTLASAYGLQGSWEHALETHLESARAFERAERHDEAAVEWLAVAGRYTATTRLDRALAAVRTASRRAESAQRSDLSVRAMAFEGNLLAMQGEHEAGRDLAQRALTLALESRHTDAASDAYRRLASVLDYSSNYPGARDAYATAVEYCRAQGVDSTARTCLGCMSYIVYRTGDWKRALEVSREVIDDPESPLGSRGIAHAVVGLVRAHRGESRSARKGLEAALALARSGEIIALEFIALFGLAAVAHADGDHEQAHLQVSRALERFESSGDCHDIIPWLAWSASFFGQRGDETGVSRCAEILTSIASQTGNAEAVAALAHAVGEVNLSAGDCKESSQQLLRAVEQNTQLEIPLEQAHSGWRAGVALARCGSTQEALRQLNAAYRIARKLGARPLAASISDDLERLGESPEEGGYPDERARDARGGLTRRQVEIAKLLAEGLTNKEIATRLFVSTRTVDMHVSNILDRLDCRSRTEATRKAADLGLLD